MLVAQLFLLTLDLIKFVDAGFEFGFFRSQTGFSLLLDLVGSCRSFFSLSQLSLLWLHDFHRIVVLDNGLNPAADTESGFACLFESVISEFGR